MTVWLTFFQLNPLCPVDQDIFHCAQCQLSQQFVVYDVSSVWMQLSHLCCELLLCWLVIDLQVYDTAAHSRIGKLDRPKSRSVPWGPTHNQDQHIADVQPLIVHTANFLPMLSTLLSYTLHL